jgi:transcription-repair coupling factor
MKGIYKFLSDTDDVIAVVDGMNAGLKEQLVSGLVGSARALYAASLYERSGRRPLLLITYNLLQAQKLYDDLLQLLPGESIRLYPSNELSVADMMIASPELRAERIDTLNALCDGEKGILIVPIAGLRRMLPPRDLWKKYLFKWRMDDRLDLQETAGHLVRMGYTRVPMVSAPGEFSIRGGILDVYPLTEDYPVRLELFDDVIDSIRYFSIENQRSLEKIQEIVLGPAREMIFEKEHMESVIRKLKEQLKVSLQRIRDEKVKEVLIQQTEYDIALLSAGEIPDDMFKYLSFAYEKPASLLDYIPEDSFICIDEVSRVLEIKNSIDKEEGEWKIGLLSEGKIMHGAEISHPIWDLLLHSPFPIVYFSLFLRHVPSISPQNIVNMTARPMQNFHGQMPVLKAEMNRWQQGKFTVVILGSDESRVAKLERVFADYDFQNIVVNESGEVLLPERVQIVKGNLANGFELPIHRFCVITEEEIFNKRAKRTVKSRQKMSNAERIQSHSQLQIGDYVVHVNHGIGKYMGIRTLEINGVHKDYLQIKYQGNDKLYVPVEQIDFVQKYVGTEGKEPKLSKLGGSEWKRVKRKVAANVQDIAEDLIQLYAERQATKGFAFSPDTELQREFEAAFPYKETEDQLRSIEEIKRDMEKPRPMDRLLCGDVGYGKTEVALRAAFKAMMDGKQVAFLVPTTILAQQHYETMRERFQDYPIKIGLLSRFRTRKEQQETIKGLKNGTIDIVVGTHRLLSKDVKFHDLGLLIIDEEQRFGVAHKEKIKN